MRTGSYSFRCVEPSTNSLTQMNEEVTSGKNPERVATHDVATNRRSIKEIEIIIPRRIYNNTEEPPAQIVESMEEVHDTAEEVRQAVEEPPVQLVETLAEVEGRMQGILLTNHFPFEGRIEQVLPSQDYDHAHFGEEFMGFYPEARPNSTTVSQRVPSSYDENNPRRRIAIFNALGLSNKLTILARRMWDSNIDYTFVSETRLHRLKDTISHPYLAAASRPPTTTACKHGCALVASDQMIDRSKGRITVQGTDGHGNYIVWNDHQVQFIGVYLPPCTNLQRVSEALDILAEAFVIADKRPLRHRVVCGDLNVNIVFEDDTPVVRNTNQRKIFNKLTTLGFIPLKLTSGRFTRFNHIADSEGTTIDHFFVNSAVMAECDPSVITMDEPHHRNLNSDHMMVVMDINLTPIPSVSESSSNWRYNISKLHEPDTLTTYATRYRELTGTMNVWSYTEAAIRRMLVELDPTMENPFQMFDDGSMAIYRDDQWIHVDQYPFGVSASTSSRTSTLCRLRRRGR